MTLTEKVAYLKGLAEGLDLDKDAKETKLFEAMFDILDEMALTINEIDEDLAEAEDYIEEVDEALSDVEEFVYDDYDFDDCDCCCDEKTYEVECPACGETIFLDESMFDEDYIECPGCGEKLELDIDFDECDCDCCCDEDED